MKTYLHTQDSKKLIIFFCGWGMDEKPFSILKTFSDVLYVYDYQTPDFCCDEIDFSKYEKIDLLAFSYGVYASAIAKFPESLKIDKRTAINGTLIPLHDKYGVPFKKFELTEKMNSETVVKFRERLFGGELAQEHFGIFEQNLPQRSAQSCTDELKGMKTYVPVYPIPQVDFDKVYVSKFDKCVPTQNQMNFWQMKTNTDIIELEHGHFPFYNYETLEELLLK